MLIRFLKRADTVVVLSRIARDEVIRYGDLDPSRIVTIPNGVDLGQLPYCPSESSPGTNLLYVGRFNVLKGVDVLVRALAEVKSSHRGVRLSLLGDGEQREELKTLAGELGLTWTSADSPQADSADIVFHGLRSDTIPFYRAADVVVLPSRTEGMSNVMLEAMALGKAIVATAVGALINLIHWQVSVF